MADDVVAGLVADARLWRAAVGERAPSYHRILEEVESLLAEGSRDLASRLEDAWGERSFSVFYERPLLLIAALRFDALGRGEAHPLWPALRDRDPDPAAVSRQAVERSLEPDRVWEVAKRRHVQTNETSRAVTWLWPARLVGCDRGARPLALVELGCAAGLNLVGDAMGAPWKDAAGATLPVVEQPEIVARLGVDRRPLMLDEETRRFLRACIWAGETERLARFEEATRALRRARPAPTLLVGDLREPEPHLERAFAAMPAGGITFAFQTIVRDYLDGATNAAYEDAMRRWLASRPRGSAAWLELEIAPSEEEPDRPAVIRAHLSDGEGSVTDLVLARTGYHPSHVAPKADAVEAFRALAATRRRARR